MSNYKITLAEPFDAATLTEISLAAKAYWDYPQAWMDLWKDDLTIKPKHFELFSIFKLVDSEKIIGFIAIDRRPAEIEIEHLWILPVYIGQGLGRQLLNYGIEKTLSAETKQILVVADPNAAAFYQKMGFETFKTMESKPNNRKLPVMKRQV